MKTYHNTEKQLFAVILNEKTVYLVNQNKSKIYKQFPLEHFNFKGWEEVSNLTSFNKLKKTFDVLQGMTKKQLSEIEKLRKIRQESQAEISVKEWIDQRIQIKIQSKLNDLAACLPEMGYSMGSKYQVCLLTLFTGNYSDCSEYAKSCKFRATHGNFTLKISLDEFKNAENIGGIFTYIYPNQKRKVKKCWWYERTGDKQYYGLKKVHGYVYAGFHSTSKEYAKAGGEGNIKAEKDRISREKENIRKKTIAEKNFRKALRLQYSYNDSLDAGNCEPGTKAFILRCGLDASKKYRGSFLVKVATEKSKLSLNYVEKMIRFKANQL